MVLLKGTHTDFLCPFGLQHRDSSLKGSRDLRGGTELTSIRERSWRGSFLPDRCAGRGHCSFSEPSPCRHRCGPHLSLHQPGSHHSPCPHQAWAHPNYFQWLFHMNALSWLMHWISVKSFKRAASCCTLSTEGSSWPLCTLHLLLRQ